MTLEGTRPSSAPAGVARRVQGRGRDRQRPGRDAEEAGRQGDRRAHARGRRSTPARTSSASGISDPIAHDGDPDHAPTIDQIVTGHTHQPYICSIPDPAGNPRLVTSAAVATARSSPRPTSSSTRAAVRSTAAGTTSTNHLVTRASPRTPTQTAIIAKWNALAGRPRRPGRRHPRRGHPRRLRPAEPRHRDPMGDLVADAILWGTSAAENGGAQIAFMNIGGVRASLDTRRRHGEGPGEITYAEAYDVAPFGNLLDTSTSPARRSRRCSSSSTSVGRPGGRDVLALGVSQGLHLHLGRQPARGPPGRPRLDDAQRHARSACGQTYRVGTLNFLADGGDLFTAFTAGTNLLGGPRTSTNLVAYFKAHPGLTAPGRPRRRVSDRPAPTAARAAPHPGCGPRRVRCRDPAYSDAMPSPTPPTAERRPHVREHHGDRVEDPYAWMRDLEDPALLAHLEAENAYAEARTEHLAPLRSRDRRGDPLAGEGDRPVGARRERAVVVLRPHRARASSTPRRCRAPLADPAERPDPEADAVPGEQVVVDGNVEAGDSEFFSLGALTVSADHRLVAFAVDTAGDERFDLTIRDIATGEVLDTSITGIGYGVELSRDGSSCSTPGSTTPGARTSCGGTGSAATRPTTCWCTRRTTSGSGWAWPPAATSAGCMLGLGSKTTSEVHVLDADDPEGEWRVLAPAPRGRRVRRRAGRRPVPHRAQHRHPGRRPRLGPVRRHEPRAVGAVAGLGRGRAVRGRRRVRRRHRAQPAHRRPDRAAGAAARRGLSPSGHGEPWDVAVDQAVHSIGLGDNPEPGQRAIQVVVESWATPRTVLDVDLATRERTVLKRQPVLGRLRRRELRRAPRVGHGIRRHPRAGLGGAPRRRRARRHATPAWSRPTASYEISSDPYFSVARLSLLDRGVVYAVAHVRGGGEMGRRWYDDGKLLAKTNTFTDTLAARRPPRGVGVDRALTGSGSKVVLPEGCSWGRCSTWPPSGSGWPTPPCRSSTRSRRCCSPTCRSPWGSGRSGATRSPTPRCTPRCAPTRRTRTCAPADYPAVLATSSLHDTRVYVTEPAKWVARLRETVTSDPVDRPGADAHRARGRARRAQRPVRRVGADRLGVGVRARPARRRPSASDG